jgi:hypothetical protein
MIDTVWSSPYISSAVPETFLRRPCGRHGHLTSAGQDASSNRCVRMAHHIHLCHQDGAAGSVDTLLRLSSGDPGIVMEGQWQ